ncbi:haloacid dehalogenase [Bacterioplanes sanyensis]|uniref:Haloacid dehalogenase n=1 Tax=Bacterioplanes sanyensis TaxID=1249553 RepID=A0A222FIC1_9GAMM|nr:HAD family hydrolase [Bacterioplanes sanyensis]ASP38520.1 haloacid dehalogenase [Bacterioplanes sanyensis]
MQPVAESSEQRAVLFDLDETLLDRTASLKQFALWQATGMLRNQINHAQQFCDRFVELDDNGRVWKDRVYQQLTDEFAIQGWSMQELLSSYELCFSGFCQEKPGVSAAIKSLHQQGYRLGLISNGKTPFQERNFQALGLCKYFDVVIVSEAVELRKPDAAIFRLACERLDVPVSQAIFVGDNPIADIQGAHQAGMKTVYIPGFFGEHCVEADRVCSHFEQLPKLVQELKRL